MAAIEKDGLEHSDWEIRNCAEEMAGESNVEMKFEAYLNKGHLMPTNFKKLQPLPL